MFTGLSAFPLTPLRDDQLDEKVYADLITRLVTAGAHAPAAIGIRSAAT
ncbi:hypothetical protein [Actinoplanes utahensis]|nr:hypothetical protein [Actinoplanes utahensis]GIF33941.1 hypothetical protein Aut01nite_69270 [Actinoplanes utahensis]